MPPFGQSTMRSCVGVIANFNEKKSVYNQCISNFAKGLYGQCQVCVPQSFRLKHLPVQQKMEHIGYIYAFKDEAM